MNDGYFIFLFAAGYKSSQLANSVCSTTSLQGKNRRGFGNADGAESMAKNMGVSDDLFSSLKYGKFVLFLHGDRNCIRLSAQRSNVQYKEVEIMDNGRKRVEIKLDDQFVASACEETLKASKAEAFNKAISELQEHCYTIKVCWSLSIHIFLLAIVVG